MAGWIKLHRQICDNEIWFLEPFTKAQAWIDLILNANHEDGVMSIRGNIIPIKRGQIGWSEITMAKRWGWSRNKTRRFLKYLVLKTMIVKNICTPENISAKTGKNDTAEKPGYKTLTSLITIVNYDLYQSKKVADDTTDDTTERQQKDSRRYTNKKDNKEKERKDSLTESEKKVLWIYNQIFRGTLTSARGFSKNLRLLARGI